MPAELQKKPAARYFIGAAVLAAGTIIGIYRMVTSPATMKADALQDIRVTTVACTQVPDWNGPIYSGRTLIEPWLYGFIDASVDDGWSNHQNGVYKNDPAARICIGKIPYPTSCDSWGSVSALGATPGQEDLVVAAGSLNSCISGPRGLAVWGHYNQTNRMFPWRGLIPDTNLEDNNYHGPLGWPRMFGSTVYAQRRGDASHIHWDKFDVENMILVASDVQAPAYTPQAGIDGDTWTIHDEVPHQYPTGPNVFHFVRNGVPGPTNTPVDTPTAGPVLSPTPTHTPGSAPCCPPNCAHGEPPCGGTATRTKTPTKTPTPTTTPTMTKTRAPVPPVTVTKTSPPFTAPTKTNTPASRPSPVPPVTPTRRPCWFCSCL